MGKDGLSMVKEEQFSDDSSVEWENFQVLRQENIPETFGMISPSQKIELQ